MMRPSITTKHLEPAKVRGSRVKAFARKRSALGGEMTVTVPYGDGNIEEEHCKAAHLLAVKLGWSGLWVGGGNADEDGYVFVNVAGDYNGAPRDSIGAEGRNWFFVERVRP